MKFSPFLLLCGAGLFAIFSSTISKSPALPIFSTYLGAGPIGVGIIAAVSAFTGAVFSIPCGILADKWGKKKMLLFSAFIFSTAPFLYLLITQLWQLAIIRFYHGLATAIFIPVAMASVSELFSKEKGERMGWFSTSTLLGRFMAPVVGGSILGALAFNPGISFKSVYLVCGITGVIALLLVFKTPAPIKEKNERQELEETINSFKTIISNKGILITSSVESAILFAYGTFETFLPLYAIRLGLSAYEVGIFFSVQIITLALTKPIMGKISDKYGRKPQIFAGLLSGAICMGSFSFSNSFIPLLVLSILFALSYSLVSSATFPFIADLSKRKNRGLAMGVLGSIMDIGHTTGPLVSGVVASYFGFSKSFLTASVVLLFASFVFNLLVREEKINPVRRGWTF